LVCSFSHHLFGEVHSACSGWQPLVKFLDLGILFSGAFNGIGILCAGLILAMMILPFIASVMRDVFEIVPPVLKESAYGIGCTTWEVVKNVVLAIYQGRRHWRHHAGIRVGRLRRNDGGHFRYWQCPSAYLHRLFAPGNSIASTLANEFGEAEVGAHYSFLICAWSRAYLSLHSLF